MIKKDALFNQINLNTLKGDVLGGITTAIVSLPLAIAFGIASGAGAEAGIYGAIIIGFFAAIFGGTPTLISEPTGPMTVVMAAVVTSMVASNPENGLAMAFTVVMIAGLFQILLGYLKLGQYISLMPYSVISGFMSGIGVLLIVFQLFPLLGLQQSGSAVERIVALPDAIGQLNGSAALIGGLCLLLLIFLPKRITNVLPGPFVALIIGALLMALIPSRSQVPVIGAIDIGLPSLQVPYFTQEQLIQMILDGLVLGTLGCIDSLLTSVISDSLTDKNSRPNKELIGQGIANTMSGLFGGLPGAGATMGTVVNVQTGARSALSGITRALVLCLIVFIASGLLENIPLAVLAAITIKVGIDILDWSFIKRAHIISREAAIIMYGVLLMTVFVDLIVAVGLGVFIANVLTIKRLTHHQSENNVHTISDTDGAVALTSDERHMLKEIPEKVMVLYLSGPLMFGMSKTISAYKNQLEELDVLLIDLTDVPSMDATSLLAIESIIKSANAKDKEVIIVTDESVNTTYLNKLQESNSGLAFRCFASRTASLSALSGVQMPDSGENLKSKPHKFSALA